MNIRVPLPAHSRRPEADPAAGHASPHVEIKVGLLIVFLFFVAFLGWAAMTPLDSAAYAPGQVVVAGHRQSLQHREGGVIRHIFVKEGQHVNAGDALIELIGADTLAAQRSLSGQVLGLEAERARLLAEQGARATIARPPEFQGLSGQDQEDAAHAMAVQQQEFLTRASSLSSHKAVLAKRVAELEEQIDGYQHQIDSSTEEKALVIEDLTSMKSLADQGYAPMSQVRALERSQADLEGRIGQYIANVAQSRQQVEETRLQILQLDTDEKEQIAKELRDISFQLDDVAPKLWAANEQRDRLMLRAPESGQVVGLAVFTDGGVVAPGARLMDIVPDQKNLVIDAQISPNDADNLHVGQSTEVRLGGGHDRTMPILKGTLTELSADSLVNEKSGAAYFAAEFTIPPSQIDVLRRAEGASFDLRAGMPAQVVVPTAKRTALQYLFEPLTRTLWRSFRER